jgi:hypothetical protein
MNELKKESLDALFIGGAGEKEARIWLLASGAFISGKPVPKAIFDGIAARRPITVSASEIRLGGGIYYLVDAKITLGSGKRVVDLLQLDGDLVAAWGAYHPAGKPAPDPREQVRS